MVIEPSTKRAIVFVDGQNLFHAVREAFGYTYPNYDVLALANTVSQQMTWRLVQTRFYTGVSAPEDHPFWHRFWAAKLSVMGRQGIHVFKPIPPLSKQDRQTT